MSHNMADFTPAALSGMRRWRDRVGEEVHYYIADHVGPQQDAGIVVT